MPLHALTVNGGWETSTPSVIRTPYKFLQSDIVRHPETQLHDLIASAADVKSYIECCDATSGSPSGLNKYIELEPCCYS